MRSSVALILAIVGFVPGGAPAGAALAALFAPDSRAAAKRRTNSGITAAAAATGLLRVRAGQFGGRI
jgi:hypothetical protein